MIYRNNVIWLGVAPTDSDLQDAKTLRLEIVHKKGLGLSETDTALANSRAIIFSVHNGSDVLIEQATARLIGASMVHGLMVRTICPLIEVDPVTRTFSSLDAWMIPRVAAHGHTSRIFNDILDHTPGPRWNTKLRIKGDKPKYAEDEVLLKRAFHDCTEINLCKITGGTSADVFQVFAELGDSRVGPHPLPFFVKFDRSPKIRRELDNYRDCSALFLPFYARPNLDFSRCVLGAKRGIIVGNFVEHSASLIDLANQGATQGIVGSLFDDALRGWRRQAYHHNQKPITMPLAKSLGGAAWQGSQAAQKRAEACAQQAKKHGATMSAEMLANRLDALPPMTHRCATMHGDLHGDNVRVRNGQAILIDLASVGSGPLVADPASLDAALALQMEEQNFAIWQTFIDKAFDVDALLNVPGALLPATPLSHIHDMLRDIRRVGLADQLSVGEYAVAVAIFLLRHAYRKPRDGESPGRRAYLFSAAEKILLGLEDRLQAKHSSSAQGAN